MAACTFAVGTADTGVTPNTSGAFTPAVGDLLIAFIVASGTTQAVATLTSSIGGFTFTQFAKGAYSSSANSIYGFVSDALVSSATSQSVTFDTASDGATGTVIFVFRVSGMTRTGLSAIRQFGLQDNGSASGTPTVSFNSGAALTGNPTLGCVGNSSSPAGMTAPTNWTEPAGGDLGYSTPTTGGEVVSRDSGSTASSITWGGTSATVYGAMIVELDTSSPPATSGMFFAN